MMDQLNKILNDLTKVQRILIYAIVAIIVYSISAGVSYSLIGSVASNASPSTLQDSGDLPDATGAVAEDPKAPRTEECLLDGVKHSKKAKDAWQNRRPLAVMIENHIEARPQSGLSQADIVYEAIAEGGITRFMAIYLCNLGDFQIGPVRSARTYFLDWVSEYDGLYAHVGGANTPGPANALGQIIDYDIKGLNQFSIGFPTFWRDYQRLGRPVATEHTMYSTTGKLWEIGAKRGWAATDLAGARWDLTFIPWKFKEDSALPTVKKIAVNFWEGKNDYQVEWNYDGPCNCYQRKNAGEKHMDLNNNQQLSSKNVVVQFQEESRANDGYENNVHLLYATKGQGKALIFLDGKAIKGQWIKANRLARTKFVDENNKEIEFNRGQIWIQTVPEGGEVKYD